MSVELSRANVAYQVEKHGKHCIWSIRYVHACTETSVAYVPHSSLNPTRILVVESLLVQSLVKTTPIRKLHGDLSNLSNPSKDQ